jgi:hypothetical protein
MKDENIIRHEAFDFFTRQLKRSGQIHAVDDMHKIKERLHDFYSPISKSIFLDEIEKLIIKDLQDHRDKAHEGKPGDNCFQEKKPVRLLFYIKQEIGTLPIVAHQKGPIESLSNRNKVFVSYSHLDKEFLKDIQRHFKPFFSHIDFWDDTKILPGQKWKEEIKIAIDQCKVGILLVSTDFLGSDFISTDELPPLLKAADEDGAVVLIVVLKPCFFEEFNNLNQYQALNPPSKPVSTMNYTEKETLYVNLVRQTKRILNEE